MTPTPPPPVPKLDPTAFTSSSAGVVERLSGDFEEQYSLSEILAITSECCHQLRCSPPLALPVLIERHARNRLASGARS